MYDYDLIARNEEAVVPQLRYVIEHKRRKFMQRDVLRYLSAECEPQMDARIRKIHWDAFSNDNDLTSAQMQASHMGLTWPVPVRGIDHVDHFVCPQINNADVVVHDE
jgi:hypothetical protein